MARPKPHALHSVEIPPPTRFRACQYRGPPRRDNPPLTTVAQRLVDNRRSPGRFSPSGTGSVQMSILKRSAGTAFVAVLAMVVASCRQPPSPPPPLPPLTESCKFTNTPVVVVPGNRVVERISAGRRGTEPSLVSVAVRTADEFRQDGIMYVPGPDLGYHPSLINHPEYFAQTGDNDARKRVTASMLWSSVGPYYDRGPEFSMLCLDVDGATIAFYTARTLQPHTIVRFDFSLPTRPPRPRPPPSPAPQEQAS